MGATVMFKPHSPNTGVAAGKGALKDALVNAYGGLPITLYATDIGILRGMSAAGVDGAEVLIDGIEEFGSIDVDVNF